MGATERRPWLDWAERLRAPGDPSLGRAASFLIGWWREPRWRGALTQRPMSGKRPGALLVEAGVLTGHTLYAVLAEQLNLPLGSCAKNNRPPTPAPDCRRPSLAPRSPSRSVGTIGAWSALDPLARHCGTTLVARDNIPVLSFIILRGRCRTYGARISSRYPSIELATAFAFLVVALFVLRS